MPMVFSRSSWPVLRFPAAGAGGVGVEEEIFLEREQQEEGVLGDGGVVDARREEQRDAELGAGLHVDLVDADAVFAEDLEAGRAFSRTLRVMASSPQM